MSDQPQPKRRLCQFSLRKLLLWTVVVALYLGTLRTLNCELSPLVFYTCWLVIVAILRVAFGPQWACLVSLVVGMILVTWFLFLDPFLVLPGLAMGGLFGFVMFVLVEGVFRAVNWVDKLMETRADHE